MTGIYVGTSEIKNIYVGTTPVKEVYVGTTKVRPSGWKPGANTIGYWKLNGDLTDYMGNYNGSTKSATITYEALPGDSNIQCAKVYSNGWDYGISLSKWICNQILAAQTSYSFGGFVKTPSNRSAELLYMQNSGSNRGMGCSIRDGKFYFFTGGQSEIYYPSNAVISANTWYSVVFTYNHTTRTKSFYLNGTLIGSSTAGSNYNTSSTPDKAYLARLNSNSLLSNLFLETNKVRDEQEAKLFHNTFKSLYGLS